jgi:hypothetical protein
MVTKSELIKEFKEVMSISLFFFICFLLFVAIKKAFLAQYQIGYYGFGTAFFGALVMGKVVLLIDKLPVINSMDHKPNIYGVLFRSLVYEVGYILFSFVEHGIKGFITSISLRESFTHNYEHLVSIQGYTSLIVLFITFIIFNAFWVIRNHFGSDQLYRLYFVGSKNEF